LAQKTDRISKWGAVATMLNRAIFVICLMTAMLAGASAQEAASPTAQSPQPKIAKPKAAKAKVTKLTSPRCPRGPTRDDPFCSDALPTLSPGNHGRTGDNAGTPKLIFNDPPKKSLPFENDLTAPKNLPRGGLLGLEFPL
jgi:hypothetical protein